MTTIIYVLIILGIVFLPTNIPGLILGALLTLLGIAVRVYKIQISMNTASLIMIVAGLIIVIQMFLNLKRSRG